MCLHINGVKGRGEDVSKDDKKDAHQRKIMDKGISGLEKKPRGKRIRN